MPFRPAGDFACSKRGVRASPPLALRLHKSSLNNFLSHTSRPLHLQRFDFERMKSEFEVWWDIGYYGQAEFVHLSLPQRDRGQGVGREWGGGSVRWRWAISRSFFLTFGTVSMGGSRYLDKLQRVPPGTSWPTGILRRQRVCRTITQVENERRNDAGES